MVTHAKTTASRKAETERADSARLADVATLVDRLNQWVDGLAYYWETQLDLMKLHARRRLVQVAMAAVGLVVLLAVTATTVYLILRGTAEGLSVLLGGREWAGDLLTGLICAAAIGGGFYAFSRRATSGDQRRLAEKYARRERTQSDDDE